jgi:DNA-binding response OmpR family regulator
VPPRPQSILLIEPDDDSRVMYEEYLQAFGFTVLTADTTDAGLTRASDADVIVTGIRVPGSRTPKCDEVYRRVMVL